MKKIAIILIVLLASVSCFASDTKKDDDVKYEVTISVTYNAVSFEEAGKIAADALERHKTACKSKVVMDKIGNNYTGVSSITADDVFDLDSIFN